MKKIILAILFLTVTSCEIQYDGETRLLFETTLKNSDGSAVSGQEVFVFVQSENISNAKTDRNGKIKLVFPAPKFDDFIEVRIENSGAYQTKVFTNIKKKDFEDYKLNVGSSIVLYKNDEITDFDIILNHVSSTTQLQSIKLEALLPLEYTVYNTDAATNPFPNSVQTNYRIVKNQNFVLKYTVINYTTPSTTEEFTVNLSVANDAIAYTLNY